MASRTVLMTWLLTCGNDPEIIGQYNEQNAQDEQPAVFPEISMEGR